MVLTMMPACFVRPLISSCQFGHAVMQKMLQKLDGSYMTNYDYENYNLYANTAEFGSTAHLNHGTRADRMD